MRKWPLRFSRRVCAPDIRTSQLLGLAAFRGTPSEFLYQAASPMEFERIWKEIIGNPVF